VTTAARLAAAVGLVGIACVAWGTLVERHWYALRRVTLPGALTGPGRLTVLHVSDVHLVPRQRRRIAFLSRLAALEPDLVVITGDLLGARDAEGVAVAAVAGLTGPGRPGVLVLGSNDLYDARPKSPFVYFRSPDHPDLEGRDPRLEHLGVELDTARLIAGLARHGYVTLRGQATVLDTPAGRVAVAGFDDPHLVTTVLPDPATIAAPARDDPDIIARIGVVHAPYLAALDVLVDADHDVLLSGHTHGGQVRLPGIGALVDNCDLPLRQARGASRHRGRWLHVSAGLGHSRYAPFRFACRPEATLIELTG
jgi:uncharacterized protein